MQRWQGERITPPLVGTEGRDLAELANTPTVSMRVVRPEQATTRPTPPLRPAAAVQPPLRGDDPELVRIREILVGPHLRDHERRLRTVERQTAEAQAHEEAVSTQAQTLAQLTAGLERERAERQAQARALELARDEHEALRAEVARERRTREDLTDRHARAIAELARQLDQERDAHLRLHAHLATELDARLERERQAHAEEIRLLASAHAAQVETLGRLVADAERALVAMQAERQYLAGLLAELGLHLVRHAASPAAARADAATQALQDAARRERAPER
jgi:hypothetical protein